MSKNSVRDCKRGSELCRAAEHQGATIRNGGKHAAVIRVEGKGSVPVPTLGKLPGHQLRYIVRQLLRLGLLVGGFVLGYAWIVG